MKEQIIKTISSETQGTLSVTLFIRKKNKLPVQALANSNRGNEREHLILNNIF